MRERLAVSRRTTGWTAGRVLLGLLIPAPFLFLTLMADSINRTYFRDTFDPVAFWVESMIVNGPAIAVAGFVMFFRFRSPGDDRIATLAGGGLVLLALAAAVWSV